MISNVELFRSHNFHIRNFDIQSFCINVVLVHFNFGFALLLYNKKKTVKLVFMIMLTLHFATNQLASFSKYVTIKLFFLIGKNW